MLAALLLNHAHGIAPGRNGIISGKFVMVQGTYVDPDEKPEPKVVKKVVRAVRKIELPKQERQRVEKLIVQAQRMERPKGQDTAALDILAYKSLVELLKRNIRETEEEALLLLLLEL